MFTWLRRLFEAKEPHPVAQMTWELIPFKFDADWCCGDYPEEEWEDE